MNIDPDECGAKQSKVLPNISIKIRVRGKKLWETLGTWKYKI